MKSGQGERGQAGEGVGAPDAPPAASMDAWDGQLQTLEQRVEVPRLSSLAVSVPMHLLLHPIQSVSGLKLQMSAWPTVFMQPQTRPDSCF